MRMIDTVEEAGLAAPSPVILFWEAASALGNPSFRHVLQFPTTGGEDPFGEGEIAPAWLWFLLESILIESAKVLEFNLIFLYKEKQNFTRNKETREGKGKGLQSPVLVLPTPPPLPPSLARG